MLELLLALIQEATKSAATPNASPDVVVTANRPTTGPFDAVVDMPADDTVDGEYVAIWPRSAYNSRNDGKVILSCLVDVHGIAEQCSVASETPSGKGFGAAALQMRPTLKLKPRTGPDGAPVKSTMNISVSFKAPLSDFDMKNQFYRGNPMAMRDVTMVSKPAWAAAPSMDDWARVYPAAAHNVEGYAVVHCRVLGSGVLTDCGVVKELPDRQGFAAAAMALAKKFRLDPVQAGAMRTASLWVDIPIRMPPPGSGRAIEAPRWLVGVDPASTPKVYPPEAAAKGIASGRGVAICVVGPDGGMASCTGDPAASDSAEFGEAAARLASAMKMSLWSADAAPVIGGQVRVGVRLNLRDSSGS
jgi:TonB family protein